MALTTMKFFLWFFVLHLHRSHEFSKKSTHFLREFFISFGLDLFHYVLQFFCPYYHTTSDHIF